MSNINNTLKSLGLNEKEIKIYLASLTIGQSTASILGNKVGIVRSTAQYTCNTLVEKMLMTTIQKGNTFLYSPEPPEKIISMVNKEYTALEKKMENAHQIMGDLNSLANPHAKTPKVKYYTGVEGVIDMYEDIFKENKTIYGALNMVEDVHPDFIEYLNNIYIPKRVKSGIKAIGLVSNTENTRKYRLNDKKMNKITLLVPQDMFPFETCIHIYGDKVAFYSYSKADMTGIIIENKKIRDTMLSILKMSWNYARKLDINKGFENHELIEKNNNEL